MQRILKGKNRKGVRWSRYQIRWTWRKSLEIRDMGSRHGKAAVRSVVVWDALGYFQQPFVKALSSWDLWESDNDRLAMERMKDDRDSFAQYSMQEIIAYNQAECRYGVKLVRQIHDLSKTLNLSPSRFDGAGAIASAMLRKEGVRQYMVRENGGMDLEEDIQRRAYIGGRFDIGTMGTFPLVHEYDIKSAYPYACTQLPCLTHARWIHHDGYVPCTWGVHRVQWCDARLWSPFPYRSSDHRIQYWRDGEGWYYTPEVEVALEGSPHEWCVDVLETWELRMECDHQPFQWISRYADRRMELIAEHNHAEKVIKLGMNAVYGKLAQRNSAFGIPRHQNFIWAGMITSFTRAMLLEAILQAPGQIIHVATDGVYSTIELNLSIGTELGMWEHQLHHQFTMVKNGIYFSSERNGVASKLRTRGFSTRHIPWDILKQSMKKKNPAPVAITVPRFTTTKEVLANDEVYTRRCTWQKASVFLSFAPPVFKERRRRDPWLYPAQNPSDRISYRLHQAIEDELLGEVDPALDAA